jgi:CubicO group peptidase (beta-lactamase class C family)
MHVDGWSPDNVADGDVDPEGVRDWHGDEAREFRWASITKPVVALATLVAAEEGVVDLDEEAGPPGSTVRHLLAHASGLPFDGTVPIAGSESGASTRTRGSRCSHSTSSFVRRCRSSST